MDKQSRIKRTAGKVWLYVSQARGKQRQSHLDKEHNSAESKMTQWKRKNVFLGIHLRSNYSDILGSSCSTGIIQCTEKNTFGTLFIRAVTHKTKLLAFKKKKSQEEIKSSNEKKKERVGGFVFLAVFNLNVFLSFFFLSLLPSVTRLSYRHEAKEWGRQSGNIRYHEEQDASIHWHAMHRARTPPRPPQASKHTTLSIWTACVLYRTVCYM